jgi:hypothetical protein
MGVRSISRKHFRENQNRNFVLSTYFKIFEAMKLTDVTKYDLNIVDLRI